MKYKDLLYMVPVVLAMVFGFVIQEDISALELIGGLLLLGAVLLGFYFATRSSRQSSD